jgi:hypothetical protein
LAAITPNSPETLKVVSATVIVVPLAVGAGLVVASSVSF